MPPRALAALAALVAVVPFSALGARDLFLRLSSYFLPASAARVRVPLHDGDFGARTAAPGRGRLTDLTVSSAARVDTLGDDAWESGAEGSFVALTLGAPGTYTVGASVRPRVVVRPAAAIDAALRESGLSDELAARARRGELGRPARERRGEHVKALFQKGAPRTAGFDRPVGHAAELVPLANPYSLGIGDTLAVRCVVDGRPAPGVAVTAGGVRPSGAAIAARRVRADSAGVARIPIAAPGRWYARFAHLQRLAGDTAAEYASKSATLTFGVRE